MKSEKILILFFIAIFIFSCGKHDPGIAPIKILSVTYNGAALQVGSKSLDNQASIIIVFSAALDPTKLKSELSISSGSSEISIDPVFSNQASKITIDTELEFNTRYTLSIGVGSIGLNGGKLEEALSVSFTTREDGVIHTMTPWTVASDASLQTVSVTGEDNANFQFYSSFPVYEENAEWTGIRAALIVVHGISRNPDDYFNYVMPSLQAENLEDSIVLISPFFKNEVDTDPGDLYWNGGDWRKGYNSISTQKISSFAVLDKIIDQLSDKEHFPVLERIVVTGNSSGGCFTHLFSAANESEGKYSDIGFDYVVSENQYFYYPDGRRIDESTNQLYTPTGCAGYEVWPIGYEVIPSVLSSISESVFNNRFTNRSVIYLLGNGDKVDGSLNTADCSADILGSTRYRRGKHMYRYMELVYPGHNHRIVEVDGVTHDGSAMYASQPFRNLIRKIIE